MRRAPAGHSLVECVVAIAVCAVGVLGVSAALLAAQRLERIARTTQAMSHLALQRIARIEASPCPPRDTSWRQVTAAGITDTWTFTRSDSGGRWIGALTAQMPGPAPVATLPIALQRRCE